MHKNQILSEQRRVGFRDSLDDFDEGHFSVSSGEGGNQGSTEAPFLSIQRTQSALSCRYFRVTSFSSAETQRRLSVKQKTGGNMVRHHSEENQNLAKICNVTFF